MDASTAAAFIALALCLPLAVLGIAGQFLALRGLLHHLGQRPEDRRRKPPPGHNPYHLP